MSIQGAPKAVLLGGKTSNGVAAGIYRVKITDASLDFTKGGEVKGKDGKMVKKDPRPYVKLELTGCKDPDHPAKEGKKVLTAKVYLPSEFDDQEKTEMMAGMAKRSWWKPLELKWPTEAKPLDPRIFVGKELFAKVIQRVSDGADSEDAYPEVAAISKDRNKLLSKEEAAVTGGKKAKAKAADSEDEESPTPEEAPAAPSRSARR